MLGTKIRELRKSKGLTLKELGEILNLGESTISMYENGKRSPDYGTLEAIANYFNVSIDHLLGRTTSNEDKDNVIQKLIKDERGSLDISGLAGTIVNALNKSVRINVYGSIPAGIPLEAIQDIEDWEDIPTEWLKGGKEYIALKVKGDSMYPKYLEGDTVIIQLQPDCETGQDCACYVNGYDATLKKVTKTENSITLNPINPNYAPQTYRHPGEVRILGVVKEIRRKV